MFWGVGVGGCDQSKVICCDRIYGGYVTIRGMFATHVTQGICGATWYCAILWSIMQYTGTCYAWVIATTHCMLRCTFAIHGTVHYTKTRYTRGVCATHGIYTTQARIICGTHARCKYQRRRTYMQTINIQNVQMIGLCAGITRLYIVATSYMSLQRII